MGQGAPKTPDARTMPKPKRQSHVAFTYAENDVVRSGDNAFRVQSHLGSGGMGEVYTVIDQQLGATRVLKLLRKGASETVTKLFRNECRVLGRINHPNIVRVAGAGSTQNDELYYVMEHLHGMALSEFLWRRTDNRLRLYSAVDLGFQLFRGLRVVHENGVVHRDIKPANLIIHRADGEQFLKIIDFGIIKLLSDTEPDSCFIGTPSYASPEQIHCRTPTTAAADIFSAGVVMFELLAGRRPYRDAWKELDVLKRAEEKAPSLGDFGDFPPKLVELVDAALDLNPSKRPTAAEAASIFGPIKRVLPGYDAQRMVTSEGLLKDPTENVQHITQADLENPTDPDGMDLPWLAEIRKQNEIAEVLGAKKVEEVAPAELAATQVGAPRRPKDPEDTDLEPPLCQGSCRLRRIAA